MITKTCPDCNGSFTEEEGVKFPRKYCPPCGAKRKVEWDAKQNGTVPVNPLQNGLPTKVPATGNEIDPETGKFQSTVWDHKQDTYEVGPADKRFKLKFFSVAELKAKMQDLRDAGLMDLPLDKLPRD